MSGRRLLSFLLVGVCAVMLVTADGFAQSKKGKPAAKATAAKAKLVDLNTDSIDAAMRTVEGTARSMGIEVV